MRCWCATELRTAERSPITRRSSHASWRRTQAKCPVEPKFVKRHMPATANRGHIDQDTTGEFDMAQVTLHGSPANTNGDLPAVGSQAPDFRLVDGAQ